MDSLIYTNMKSNVSIQNGSTYKQHDSVNSVCVCVCVFEPSTGWKAQLTPNPKSQPEPNPVPILKIILNPCPTHKTITCTQPNSKDGVSKNVWQ